MEELTTREKLILAGMDEIRAYGIQGFSLRRVAKACGVSCAAPYKHFAGKEDLFDAMVDYVNEKWRERMRGKLELSGPVENAIAYLAADYVRFLGADPHFKSVLLIKETGLDSPVASEGVPLSVTAKRLFIIYGRKHDLSRGELRGRIFIVRSLIFGAAVIIGADSSGTEERLARLGAAILEALK